MQPALLQIARLAVTPVVVAAVLAGCGGAPAPAPPGQQPPAYTASLTALVDKVDSISSDSCTTRPAVTAYPSCARYVAEVGNLALAVQGMVASAANAGELQATAGRLANEVGQFSRAGCVLAPGVAGPPAQACGEVLAAIQADVRALRGQLRAAAPKSSG